MSPRDLPSGPTMGVRPSSRTPPALRNAGLMQIKVQQGRLGLSLIAVSPIASQQTILEFEGPIITFREARAKGDHESWPLQIGVDRYLDLAEPGCFVNHSCQPNAGVRDGTRLVAIQPISPAEEVVFDYSTTMDEDGFDGLRGYELRPCRCGSPSCRGAARDFKYLPRRVQARYLALDVVPGFIRAPLGRRSDPVLLGSGGR